MKKQKGFTLVEVVVSILLTAVMVSSIFSIALTAKRAGTKSDRRVVANEASRQLTDMLKSYVSADTAQTEILGPSTGSTTWSMNNPGAGITDSMGAVYALAVGTHRLTGFLPSWFEAAPYSARITYVVVDQSAGYTGYTGSVLVPQVTVSVDWTEPP